MDLGEALEVNSASIKVGTVHTGRVRASGLNLGSGRYSSDLYWWSEKPHLHRYSKGKSKRFAACFSSEVWMKREAYDLNVLELRQSVLHTYCYHYARQKSTYALLYPN